MIVEKLKGNQKRSRRTPRRPCLPAISDKKQSAIPKAKVLVSGLTEEDADSFSTLAKAPRRVGMNYY